MVFSSKSGLQASCEKHLDAMSNLTPESVVICLIGNVEGEGDAGFLHHLCALIPLHSGALYLLCLRADRVACRLTGPLIHGNILSCKHRVVIAKDHRVLTLPLGDFLLDDLVLQNAVFPADIPAVFISIPDLLSLLVDDPLGVTLLLGHRCTHRHLLHFLQDLYTSLLALLGYKRLLLCRVKSLVGQSFLVVTIGIGNYFTSDPWYRDAEFLLTFVAGLLQLECADLLRGDVVVQLAVTGGVNTVVIMSITMVLSTKGEACQGQDEDLLDHPSVDVLFLRLDMN